MQTDINCVFQGLGDIGAIYISNFLTAKNIKLLQQYNIKSVITAAKDRRIQYKKQIINQYLHLDIEDTQNFKIDTFFQQTYNFIEQSRKKTNILIHCHVGASRSAAIVIAYLIKKYNYSLNQIYTLIKRKRTKIWPNPGFLKQLEKYSEIHSVLNSNIKSTQIRRKPSNHHQRSYSIGNYNMKVNSVIKKQNQQPKFEKEQQQTKLGEIHTQRSKIEEKLQKLRNQLITSKIKQSPQRKLVKKISYNVEINENTNPNKLINESETNLKNDSIMSKITNDGSKQISTDKDSHVK